VYRKQVRRRRAVLALLVAASIALLTAYFGESAGGGLHAIQRGIVAVIAPVEEGANRALKPARDFIGWIDDTISAKGDNEELRAEVDELRRRLTESDSAASENRELRELTGLRGLPAFPKDYRFVTGRVIARSPTVWYSTLKVDKGSSSGIAVDDAVVSAGGLVGHVSSVTGGTANVRLITDHRSAVSAVVTPAGGRGDQASGIVKAEIGNPNDLLVDFIEKGRRIGEGWTVSTAGWRSSKLESLYPPGIPIGRVTRASLDEQETYQRVHMKPFADVRRAEFLQVLIGGGRGGSKQ